MKKERKEKLFAQVKSLKDFRTEACKRGDVATQQEINYQILGIAQKLKVDYYSIA